jgi:uncharacterized protein (TIGR03437 family)
VAGGNLTTYWGDCLKAFPVPDSARWIDITGRLIKVGRGADLSGGDLPQYSLSNQQWRNFLKAQAQHAIDIGADGFQIDNAGATTNNIAFGGDQGGSFDPFTMGAFRDYLAKTCSSAVLRSQFDISDIATFDYGAWIRQRGLQKTWNQIPLKGLATEFVVFRTLEEKNFVRELTLSAHQYAQEKYGRSFTVSTNTNFGAQSHHLLNEVDYFLNEHYTFNSFQGALSPFACVDIKSYKGVRRWPVVVAPEPLYLEGLPKATKNMIRLALGDIYAAGGTVAFAGAFNAWTVNNKIAIDPDILKKYAQFILVNHGLFENLRYSPQVAILDSTALRQARLFQMDSVPSLGTSGSDESHYYGTARLLVDNNVQYDSILVPDGLLSTVPSFSAQQLQRYKVLVMPNVLILDDAQAGAVLEFVRAGGVVIATGMVGTHQPGGKLAARAELARLQERDGVTPFGNGVFVYTRRSLGSDYQKKSDTERSTLRQVFRDLVLAYIKPEIVTGPVSEVYRTGGATAFLYNDAAGDYIAHLVNYDYNEFTDQFAVKDNVAVSIRVPMRGLRYATFVSPDLAGPLYLPVTQTSDGVSVVLPRLEAYGILILQANPASLSVASQSSLAGERFLAGTSLTFRIDGSSSGGGPLFYRWFVNGKMVSEFVGESFQLKTLRTDQGEFYVGVEVSDASGVNRAYSEWRFTVVSYRFPGVVFDEAHDEYNSIVSSRAREMNPVHPDWVYFGMLKSRLDSDFEVTSHTDGELNRQALAGKDVLVLAAPGRDISADELESIASFVQTGGGLLFLGNSGLPRNPNTGALLSRFGVEFDSHVIFASDGTNQADGNFFVSNFVRHPAVTGITRFWANYGGSFSSAAAPSTPVAFTDSAAFRDLNGDGARGPSDPTGPFSFAAAAEVGRGRAFFMADNAFHDAAVGYISENSDLFVKALNWLTEALNRLPPAGGSCSFTLTPRSQTFSPSPATGAVVVAAGAACGWTAVSHAPWITIASGASGSSSGSVAYSLAGNAAVGSRSGAITIGEQTFIVNQMGSSANQPVISQQGVVSGASFRPGASPGAWVAIFGTNLAPATRTWRSDEIVNGKLPTQLDAVSVTISGNPAAIYYINPNQLNVQVPSSIAQNASVPLQVTSPQGSVAASVVIQQLAPAFFTFPLQNPNYIVAQHADYSVVGKVGLYPASTPAKPGEVILLYGTGFGPTSPAIPAGQVVTQPAPLINNVVVRIGGVQAEVRWAGLSGAGLNQLNVQVPDSLPDGDALVVAEAGGYRTQDNAFITVRR